MAQTAPYPTVAAPYGLKPINLIGGQVFAGATRQLPIATSSVNYNTAIFNGDVVQLASSGTIIVSTLDTESSFPFSLNIETEAARASSQVESLPPTPLEKFAAGYRSIHHP